MHAALNGPPLVAIQVGAASLIDEGVPEVLDIVTETARVNTLFLASLTWTRGTGGRQVPGYPLPDHGIQDYDRLWRGGNYATMRPCYYRNTALGAVGRATEHGDWDIFEAVLPEAHSRNLKCYAWMEESSYARHLLTYPNFVGCLEVDAWRRPATRPCFNNPEYRTWHLAIVEDCTSNYRLDGLAWASERSGPLSSILERPATRAATTCFCSHCRRLAREQGIDVERAAKGLRLAWEWNSRLTKSERPRDGAFVELWRLLLQYPELLSWHSLWTSSQHQLYRDIYGVAKASDPNIDVGWHLAHAMSFSPFYRADHDYRKLRDYSDFLKVVTYNNCAGARFYDWISEGFARVFLADVPSEVAYDLLAGQLGLDEAPFDDLHQQRFSPEYVSAETARAIAGVEGDVAIYAGIDVDIPIGTLDLWTDEGVPADGAPTGSREQVCQAVVAALTAGADGVVLSRKYSEMRIATLAGAGDALRQLHLAE